MSQLLERIIGMFLTVLCTHHIWRKKSKWCLLLEGWDHPVQVSRGRDEEAKSGKPSLQGCGSHTVLPRAPGSREVPSGLLGEETREQITTSSQNYHLCFNHSSCDSLLFIWGLLLLLLSHFSSVPTLWDPIDGSPPGSPIPGTFQARTLEWVAISFSLGIHKFHLLKKKKFPLQKT